VATWDDVGRIVSERPETAEASPRKWRVRKKLIAWERPLRKADYAALGADAPDGDILGARVADEGREVCAHRRRTRGVLHRPAF
jgi:hypothetical protein